MSRPEQAKGDSLRRQLKGARDYATSHGLTLVEDLRDIGVSAFKGRNSTEGTLGTFLKAIEAGTVKPGAVLIIENLDRLSRQQVSTALRLFLSILDAGVEIATLSDGQRYTKTSIDDGPTQILISILSMSRAHEESALKARRVSEAWHRKRENAAAGAPMTAMGPAWLSLTADRKKWLSRDGREHIVRRIFSEATAGIGAMTIARRLTQEGIAPWGPDRKKSPGRLRGWQPSAIKKILSNEAAMGTFQPHIRQAGKRVPHGPAIADYFPVVVSPEDFWAARAAIQARSKGASGRKGPRIANLLAGLCKCGACGGPVHLINKGQPPKGGRYLQCDRARRHAGCRARDLHRYEDVERGVFATLSQASFASIFEAEKQASKEWREQSETIEAQIRDLKHKQSRFLELLDDDADSVDDPIAERIRLLREQIRAATAERRRMMEKIRGAQAVEQSGDAGEQFERALEKIEAIDLLTDESERYSARANLAQALRRVVRAVVFHIDLATVHFVDKEQVMVILGHRCFDPAIVGLLEELETYAQNWDGEEPHRVTSEKLVLPSETFAPER
jgi:uncharacterized protein YdcH (DUF465 family)